MSVKTTTFTLLVSVTTDDDQVPTPADLASTISRMLEEKGEFSIKRPVYSAQVDAFKGDALDAVGMPAMMTAKSVHRNLRRP